MQMRLSGDGMDTDMASCLEDRPSKDMGCAMYAIGPGDLKTMCRRGPVDPRYMMRPRGPSDL